MGSFIRKKKDGKNEYFYEVTTTYDPSIKRSRQKVKYLGKNIDGKPARVRTCVPRRSYNYGELVPIQNVMNTLGIGEMLAGLLSENDCQALQVFALNRVLRPVPSHLLESWYESTILCKTSPDLGLKSQQVSALLDRIGGSSVPDLFMDRMAKKHGVGSSLVFDITSLSSSSQQIELLEYGHNRENNGLEQVNLGLVVDKKNGLPLMYDLYSGSIVDVVTLVNTLRRIRARGITGYCLVLDRGFYSKNNLREMIREKASFIIPGTLKVKNVKELITRNRDIRSPRYLQKYDGKTMYVKPIRLALEDMTLDGYLYYDPTREQQEKEKFMGRLYDTRVKLENKELDQDMNPRDVYESIAGNMKPYLKYKVTGVHFQAEVRSNAVSRHVNKLGRFVLLYHGVSPGWDECLAYYREKDVVEKAFKTIKSDVRLKPLNVKKTGTLRGLVFACFIALITRMRLLRLLKEKGLLPAYTMESLFLELEKIKKIELENGELVTTELTKKQKDILKALNLQA